MANDILIVDDEDDIRMVITGILEDEGYTTRQAADSDSALEAIAARSPNLAVLDVWMEQSRLDGLQLMETIRVVHPNMPVVMISGHGNIEMAVNAIKLGAYDFIEKPFKADRLLLVVQRALEAARLRSENEELRRRAGGDGELIGRTQVINQLRQSIQRVAPTGSRVLITGPAGAGKEVVARMIHDQSQRSHGPFVVLNCATMHPDRLESELFGLEDGDGQCAPGRIGTLEKAHGGTLLLDEVADMPPETQGKIVRVLQEQTFQRVGGQRSVEVDVRVIAATNRDLDSLMAEGSFREDLYYRLNVVPIRVPALRERAEDVPTLIEAFMAKAAASSGVPLRVLSAEAMAALQGYDWPGNVRQLRNVVDWILIMAPGGPGAAVGADMLPPDIIGPAAGLAPGEAASEVMAMPLREAREVFERQYLAAQVSRFGGNISRTASFVGMERSALHRKLRSLGVNTAERR